MRYYCDLSIVTVLIYTAYIVNGFLADRPADNCTSDHTAIPGKLFTESCPAHGTCETADALIFATQRSMPWVIPIWSTSHN